MKILPNFNKSFIGFKGYDARKLKALYMQNAYSKGQREIYKELYDVGQKENFDVFIHTEDKIIKNPDEYEVPNDAFFNRWSQDNKIFYRLNDEDNIIIPNLASALDVIEPINLSSELGIEKKSSKIILEGGNIFIGKKDDNKNYIIVGYNTVRATSIYNYLKHNEVKRLTDEKIKKFVSMGYLYKDEKLKDEKVNYDDYLAEENLWEDITKEKFIQEFDIEEKNLHVIPQPNYHIDLAIRPLIYPYILINDNDLSDKRLKSLKLYSDDIDNKFLKPFKEEEKNLKQNYTSGKVIAKQLKKEGFKPILIAGGYGLYKVNFMNAIVLKNDDGLIYITNSAECPDKRYKILQDLFREDLIEKCPEIKKIYFIKGGDKNFDSNIMMDYLQNLKGGIHCLCAEYPDFDEE